MAKELRKRDIFNTLVVSFTLGIDLLSGAREIWKFTLPLMYYELICTLDYFNIWVCLLWAGENLRSLRSSLKLVDPSQHIPSKIEVDVSKLDIEDKVLKQEVLFCFLLVNSSTDERSARFYIWLGSTSVWLCLFTVKVGSNSNSEPSLLFLSRSQWPKRSASLQNTFD